MATTLAIALALGTSGCESTSEPTQPSGTGTIRVTVDASDSLEVRIRVVAAPTGGGIGGGTQVAGVGDTLTFENLTPGTFYVIVHQVPAECSTEGRRSWFTNLVADEVDTFHVSVLCGDAQTLAFWTTYQQSRPVGIQTVRPDGSGLSGYITGGAIRSSPAWAPGHVAFAHVRRATDEPPKLSVEDRDTTLLPAGGDILVGSSVDQEFGDLAWSPLGDEIAFVLDGDLWLVGRDGADARLVVEDAREPAWSPDGAQIVFVRAVGDRTDLLLADANGTGVTPLTTTPGRDERSPAWSPDGGLIVFATGTPASGDLRSIAPDGSGEARIAELAVGSVVFSPTGERLAVTLDEGTVLATLPAEGGAIEIVQELAELGDPVW